MRSSGPNPYAPPVEETVSARPTPIAGVPVEDPLAELSAQRVGKDAGPWVLLVYADRIVASALDGDVHTVLRSELGHRIVILPMSGEAVLTLRTEKITLKLVGDEVESLRHHLGADLETWALQLSLRETKNSLWSGLGMSALWFFGNGGLLIGVLAVAYLIAGLGRLLRGGRWLFLLAGVRAVLLIVAIAIDVFVFDAAWWIGFLGLPFMMGASLAFRRFSFFRPLGG